MQNLPADEPPIEVPPKLQALLQSTSSMRNVATHLVDVASVGATPMSAKAVRPLLHRMGRTSILTTIAAVLILSVIVSSFFFHSPKNAFFSYDPLNSSRNGPAAPDDQTKGTTNQPIAGPAIFIPPQPVLSESTIYIQNNAFRSDDGSFIRTYKLPNNKLFGSPVVVDGVMYVAIWNNTVYAIQLNNGSTIWYRTVKTSNHQPVEIATVANGVVYATMNGTGLEALRTKDGAFLWEHRPANTNDEIFVSAVTNSMAYVGGINQYQGNNTPYVYAEALSTQTGKPLWRETFHDKNISEIVAQDNVIYFSLNHAVVALNANDGQTLWQHPIASNNFTGAPTVQGGIIYVVSDNGYLYALNSVDGSRLWQYKMGDTAQASYGSTPIVENGIVYVSDVTDGTAYLFAIRARDGAPLWRYKIGERLIPSIAVGNGSVYFVTTDNHPPPSYTLYALRASDGTVRWHTNIPEN
ncbi:MAG: PQQ-binding-like beta-propeller repeat protein, partial [Chloroflexota bacterium]|nr:PQQ-binding-like beta-propeller repeat protein [Chloroflexota bacterium]